MIFICAMHRIFQSEEDDRIMEGEFDPEIEKQKREAEAKLMASPGLLARLMKLLPIKS